MARANAGAARQRFDRKIRIQMAHDPADEFGEAVGLGINHGGLRECRLFVVRRGGRKGNSRATVRVTYGP